jgi:dCTP diphosphatase
VSHRSAPARSRGRYDAPMSQLPSPPDAARASHLVDVEPLQRAVARFARERDWEPFHSPKNLAMALTGEVGELVELFQWLSEEASRKVGHDPATARHVRDELADVLIYLVRLAAVLEVDLDEAVRTKLSVNALKYPVEGARGNAKKYSRR